MRHLVSFKYSLLIVGGVGLVNKLPGGHMESSIMLHGLPDSPRITLLNDNNEHGPDYIADITNEDDINSLIKNNSHLAKHDVIVFEYLPYSVYTEQTMKNVIRLMHSGSILIVVGNSIERATKLLNKEQNNLFTMIMEDKIQKVSIYKIT